MATKNDLTALVLAGAVALGGIGCEQNSKPYQNHQEYKTDCLVLDGKACGCCNCDQSCYSYKEKVPSYNGKKVKSIIQYDGKCTGGC